MIGLQPSLFDDELKPQPATNLMKTEEHSEAAAVFLQKLTDAVAELKEQLRHDYEQTYPGLGEIIRLVLDEEEAKAWDLSSFPHLFLPDLVEEHIAQLGLQPAHARPNNILAPSDLTKIKNPQLSRAYAADRHEMLATSPK
jgi:hypothetical protein